MKITIIITWHYWKPFSLLNYFLSGLVTVISFSFSLAFLTVPFLCLFLAPFSFNTHKKRRKSQVLCLALGNRDVTYSNFLIFQMRKQILSSYLMPQVNFIRNGIYSWISLPGLKSSQGKCWADSMGVISTSSYLHIKGYRVWKLAVKT